MKFKQSGLAKSETGLVRRAEARRLHFKGTKKSRKQEARGFMVDSFTTLFPQDSRLGTWNAIGRLETGDSGLLRCSRLSQFVYLDSCSGCTVKWRSYSSRNLNCGYQKKPVLRK